MLKIALIISLEILTFSGTHASNPRPPTHLNEKSLFTVLINLRKPCHGTKIVSHFCVGGRTGGEECLTSVGKFYRQSLLFLFLFLSFSFKGCMDGMLNKNVSEKIA